MPVKVREDAAREIHESIKDLVVGCMISGSTAYGGATEESDLDLIAVLDFGEVDVREVYNKLGIEYHPGLVRYAARREINTFMLYWIDGIKKTLICWDKTALSNIAHLRSPNSLFVPEGVEGFVSMSREETQWNLRGGSQVFQKGWRIVEGGIILEFQVSNEHEGEFYMGIQSNNMILPLTILGGDKYISHQRRLFRGNLRKRLIEVYGKNDGSLSLYKALPEKIRGKLPEKTKLDLDKFF